MKKFSFLLFSLIIATSSFAGSVQRLNPTTAEISLKNGQRLYIDFYGPNIFRLFQDPNGGILRDPEASPEAHIMVSQPRKAVSLTVEGNRISTKDVVILVNTDDGSLMVNGMSISAAGFQKGKTSITLSEQPNEYFFGGGVQNGRFSHRGQIIAIENTNNWVDGGVASPTPFYWSTAGYAIMGYTFTPGKYDFGATEKGKTILSHETDYLDYFFMFDKGAVALLNDFYQLTGNPVLLPKFGFYEGHLNAYNRDYWTENENGFMAFEDGKRYNESQKDNGGVKESLNGEKQNYQFSARAAIDRYLNNDMPLGWFLPNDGYGAGYGQTETLDGNIQNLKDFGDYARSKGVEIGLWTQSDLHPKEGVEPLLQRDIVKEVRDAGVRVLKTDVAWVGAGYSFGLNGVSDVAQIMPYYGNNARPFIISLDGWAGTQRYAGIWTGDQTGGEWEYIRFHIPTYIGSGLSGQPNITSDMDGIFGGKNLPVNIRDFQWKTFTPMQLNMDGWGSNPKYPQALGEPATSINRWYLKLKSRLLPYTYSIAHEAINGKPLIRAMFLEDENAYTLGTGTQYQFMYGPDFLVAPIYKETQMDKDGNDIRNGIYLPTGQWVDYFTGEVYQGGRIINNYESPIWKLPIFVKRGAIIPTHKPTNNPSQMDTHLRCYDFYPSMAGSEFTEYDDDGKTEAYKNGECVYTQIKMEASSSDGVSICISPAKGNYEGYEPTKVTQLRIYSSTEPKKLNVKVGGKKIKLAKVDDYDVWKQTENSYYFGKSNVEHMDITALMVNVGSTDVSANSIMLEAQGIKVDTTDKLLSKTGVLAAPNAQVTQSNIAAYEVTPSWEAIDNADYYEIGFDGQIYSTIQQTQYTIDGLRPETTYEMKVRAINASGASEWTPLTVTTTSDPLEFAIHGARATTSCANQSGQGTRHLFDFDESSTWHTKWGENAVPFDLTIDLHSVNLLDKLQYVPRPDAGNGTLLQGSIEYSMDRQTWTPAGNFDWTQDNTTKQINFEGQPKARYLRFHVTKAVGNFGSGQQMYIFRVPGSEFYIPGDINQDGRIDENDLTSYMNYTGLRQGDGDFGGYISKGDLNQNGLIDIYDISAVAVELESGVSSRKIPSVQGKVTMVADKQKVNAGDEVTLTLRGTGMTSVNGISLCIPYDANDYEYVGIEAPGLSQMYNMTYDRLHTNGQKALYPTFVNLGEQNYTEGDQVLMTIKFKAKKTEKVNFKSTDGMLADKYLNIVRF